MNEPAVKMLSPRGLFFPIFAILLSFMVSAFSNADKRITQIPSLEEVIPTTVGNWQAIDIGSLILPLEVGEKSEKNVLYRSYVNPMGEQIMLVIAYGAASGDAVRLHMPEVCYQAQGFEISHQDEGYIEDYHLPIRQLQASRLIRKEAITYWLRSGQRITNQPSQQQIANLLAGLGKSTEGVLVRISTYGDLTPAVMEQHNAFIAEMLTAMTPRQRAVLVPEEVEPVSS
ncbi:MAG: exosortase C-terminal domain/associated protein EpsI [bacterium]